MYFKFIPQNCEDEGRGAHKLLIIISLEYINSKITQIERTN